MILTSTATAPSTIKSGNENIAPGQSGNFEAVNFAMRLDVPFRLDLPSGALIVWCLALLAMLTYGCGPRRTTAVSVAS